MRISCKLQFIFKKNLRHVSKLDKKFFSLSNLMISDHLEVIVETLRSSGAKALLKLGAPHFVILTYSAPKGMGIYN